MYKEIALSLRLYARRCVCVGACARMHVNIYLHVIFMAIFCGCTYVCCVFTCFVRSCPRLSWQADDDDDVCARVRACVFACMGACAPADQVCTFTAYVCIEYACMHACTCMYINVPSYDVCMYASKHMYYAYTIRYFKTF